MKNELTYHAELTTFEKAGERLFRRSHHGFNPAIDRDLCHLLAVTFMFKETLAQHKLSMGGDIKYELTPVGRVVADEIMPFMRVDLTFKDETTALLFKLSHDAKGDA